MKLKEQFKDQKLEPLKRTGRWFGGLRKEFLHRLRYYRSDFTDGFNVKCLTSVLYIFFVCLIPALTFGAILNPKTNGWLGVKETLMATSIGGIIFAIFSAQPLLLLGVTGPVLIFEKSLFMIFHIHPVLLLVEYCSQSNDTSDFIIMYNRTHPAHSEAHANFMHYSNIQHPNTALLSTVLLFGTFTLAYAFHRFRESKFLSAKVRRVTGNLSLSAAVVLMVLLNWLLLKEDALTSKLWIGSPYEPTRSERPWVVSPIPDSILVPVAALAAGFLYFFILFVEIEAGQILISGAKPGLQKGTGFHWDLLVSGFLAIFCSVFGLPWLCAAIVQSNEHVASLTLFHKRAPGEMPEPTKIVEQRVTAILLNALIGLSLLATDLIQSIPVAVLFGAFLFMGYCNIRKLQMLARTVLFFIPVKYHPTTLYCIRVRTYRMHLYTVIQLAGLILVIIIKKFKVTAFAFPFAILLCVLVRQVLLPKIFSKVELMALDGEHAEEDSDLPIMLILPNKIIFARFHRDGKSYSQSAKT